MISQLVHWAISAINFILHFDVHLESFIANYGAWTYAILGGIVFCETGLVVTPVLPGDSLLFAVGALTARGSLSFPLAGLILALAAILGDAVNYSIGFKVGPKAIGTRWVKKEYADRTVDFFARYGAKTVMIARFVPIVRTFAPFMAGVGRMPYRTFAVYNVAGGLLWVGICLTAGFFFGNLEVVKKNFSLVVLGIVFVSVLPAVFEALRKRTQHPPSAARRKVVL